ncbi:MAG TPA: acyltransferase [Chloroflexota bacterium]|nr:acyltransferase [Chloroflexota bacterium]
MAATEVSARAPAEARRLERTAGGRLAYLDNLRVFLIAGVIVSHAATAYIGGGAWVESEEANGVNAITVLALIGLIGALFWIGLFFLISGMLAPRALAHRGAWPFLRDRALRLGVPFLVYLFVVMPLMHYWLYVYRYKGPGSPMPITNYLVQHELDLDPGPLWFLAALLVITTAYTLWWRVRPRRAGHPRPFRAVYLVGLPLLIGAASFGVHLALPAFTHQYLDLHFWQWPQYIILFWFGTLCADRRWLPAVPNRIWHRCLVAMLGAVLAVPVVAVTGGALSGQGQALTGGWHWQALATGMIEGVLAVAGSLWFLELFRRYSSHQGPLGRQIARSAFGAYILQAPVLTGLAVLLEPLRLSVEIRFLLLAPATLFVCFAVAWLLVVRLHVGNRIV